MGAGVGGRLTAVLPATGRGRGRAADSRFTGDPLLSIIISKAILLAEDDKIRDESILRQL